jgi:hypothetical protein
VVFGIEIVHQKTNPAGDQQKDNADGLASSANVHLENLNNGFDAKDDADDVDNCCYHSEKY